MPRSAGRHVDDPAAVGTRLRQLRTRAGLSQRDLAFEGCSYAYISRIEAGQRVPSMQVLQEFGRRLGVSATYLATGTDAPDSVDLLDEADLARRLGDDGRAEGIYLTVAAEPKAAPARRAHALAGLGEIAFQRGDSENAARLFEQALEEKSLSREVMSEVADRLGRLYALRGEHERALAVYEQELRRAEEANDQLALLRFSTLLANVVLDAGNAGRAQELLARAIGVADRSPDPLDRARLWWSQSRLHDSEGRPELAAHYAKLALGVLEDREQLGFAAVAYLLLAYIENERNQAEAALAYLEQAEPVIAASGNRFHLGLVKVERSRALLRSGEHREAGSLAMSALPLIGEASAIDRGRAYALVAEVFADIGDHDRAQELYELALEILPGGDRNVLRVVNGLSEILEEQGRTEEALALLKDAMRLQQNAATRR